LRVGSTKTGARTQLEEAIGESVDAGSAIDPETVVQTLRSLMVQSVT
jgi:hypothetical protein